MVKHIMCKITMDANAALRRTGVLEDEAKVLAEKCKVAVQRAVGMGLRTTAPDNFDQATLRAEKSLQVYSGLFVRDAQLVSWCHGLSQPVRGSTVPPAGTMTVRR